MHGKALIQRLPVLLLNENYMKMSACLPSLFAWCMYSIYYFTWIKASHEIFTESDVVSQTDFHVCV